MFRHHQRGMTMWGTAFVIGVVVFFMFLLFKLLPVYFEDFKVKTAMDGLAKEANASPMSRAELVERLSKRFDVDNVTTVKPTQVVIQQQGRAQMLRLNYEVVVPLAYNVSALLEFDHARPIRAAE
jgi:Domain of unknown function (DUF4845)